MNPKISRRRFVHTSALAATAAYAVPEAAQRGAQGDAGAVPDAIRALKPFPGKAVPISDQERLARIDKARRRWPNTISAQSFSKRAPA